MADRPEMFGPTRGFSGCRFNGTMKNVVGPTLVAMATKFGLGAEIQSHTGLYDCLYASNKKETCYIKHVTSNSNMLLK